MSKKITHLLSLMFLFAGLIVAQTSIDVTSTSNGSPIFLNEFIDSNPGYDEYRLVSTDASYFLNATLNVSASMKIVGITDASDNNRKPTIQPLQAADQSDLAILFLVNTDNVTFQLEDLYIFGKSNANSRHAEVQAISVTSDNVHFISDKCVYDEITQFIISYEGKWDKFTIRNNYIRNGSKEGNNPWVSELLRNLNPSNPTGDIIIQNNTFLGLGAYVACPNIAAVNSKLIVDHNTIVYGTKNPLFIFAATNAQITNNIFYSTFCFSGNKASISGGWDDAWDPGNPPAVISLDTLQSPNFDFSDFAPGLIGDPDSIKKGEALRNVNVENNVYFWPSEVTDFITTYNSSASADKKVQMPIWINDRTQGMFDDNSMWPGFKLSGNINVDPGFEQQIKDITTSGNFIKYLENCYKGGADQVSYHFEANNPSGELTWQPQWPLKEDFAYSNVALKTAGTDGKPIGDMTWFGVFVDVNETKDILPSNFELFQNYPNPFNPSTVISFSIPESSIVSLKIYDITGKVVKTVLDNVHKVSGVYEYTVDLSKLSSGIYFYRLQQNIQFQTKKMMLLK